jgi:hypothetical protein
MTRNLNGFTMVSKRLGLAGVKAKRDRVEASNQHAWGLVGLHAHFCAGIEGYATGLPVRLSQSPAVLGVKPAFEDVDAQFFLAFHCAIAEDRIESNNIYRGS